MIGALTAAMAGMKVLGGISDMSRIESQKKMEIATNNANASMEQANIMKNYTGVFQKMVSDLGTQNNLLATAKVDKASTLFTKARQEHEKSFLENKANMESDMRSINTQRDMANTQAKLTAVYNKQATATNMVTGLMDSFMSWKGYNVGRTGKVQGLTK